MLCKTCLLEMSGKLHEDDRRVISALVEKGVLNKESASQVSGLTTSRLRDALSRLRGGTFIEETRVGNSILLRLSDSGKALSAILDEITNSG